MNNISTTNTSLRNDGLVSTRKLAEILDRKPQTIRKWLSEDRLPKGLERPAKIHGRNFWRSEDIRRFISFSYELEISPT
jgi:hypothetical protein